MGHVAQKQPLAHSFLEKAVRRAQALCRSNTAKDFWQGTHAMPFELSSIRIRSMIQDMTDTIYLGLLPSPFD